MPHAHPLKAKLRALYTGHTPRAQRFRYGLIAFDILTIVVFILLSFIGDPWWVPALDLCLALAIGTDFLIRLWIAPRKSDYLVSFTTIADLIVLVSLLLPAYVDNLGFLRTLRALRLLRSYHVLKDLRATSPWFLRNEEVIGSAVNLLVFIFFITAVVFVTQNDVNPQIRTYIDALYFTVTTLTTTGFGDITLQGPLGRLLAVSIMFVGVGLFLRLVQAIFRPTKIRCKCPDCGLTLHDMDAVHCKHCGRVINIETEGFV